MYSNPSNTLDYRQFEYNLSNETNDYSSFQLKFELRHATTDEINVLNLEDPDNPGSPLTPGENLFPHVYDYRAIALT